MAQYPKEAILLFMSEKDKYDFRNVEPYPYGPFVKEIEESSFYKMYESSTNKSVFSPKMWEMHEEYVEMPEHDRRLASRCIVFGTVPKDLDTEVFVVINLYQDPYYKIYRLKEELDPSSKMKEVRRVYKNDAPDIIDGTRSVTEYFVKYLNEHTFDGCRGMIPNSFVICGEGKNYCSIECMEKSVERK